MKTEQDLVTRLGRLIRDQMENVPNDVVVEPQTRLFDGGLGLDSIAVVELIALTEEHFEIELDYDDLSPEAFETIESLAATVTRHLDPAS